MIAPPTNIQSYTGPFVGSKNSNVYHYPWCYEAKKILPENLVTFATVADACAAGYRPCEVCNPPACNPTPTPSPSPTPTPKTYQVIVTETDIRALSQTWTATVLVNGVQIQQSNLTTQIVWTVNGQPALGYIGHGSLTITIDKSELNSAPFHKGENTISAEYQGTTGYTTETWSDVIVTPTPPAPEPSATPVIIRGG